MVTHLEYSIIWFMFLTASFCSSSIVVARERVASLSWRCSTSVSVGGACFLASSSSFIIFSLRALDTAWACSRLVSAMRFAAAMSSAVMTEAPLIMRSRSCLVSVTTSRSFGLIFCVGAVSLSLLVTSKVSVCVQAQGRVSAMRHASRRSPRPPARAGVWWVLTCAGRVEVFDPNRDSST